VVTVDSVVTWSQGHRCPVLCTARTCICPPCECEPCARRWHRARKPLPGLRTVAPERQLALDILRERDRRLGERWEDE
jgi:hypothetical protein